MQVEARKLIGTNLDLAVAMALNLVAEVRERQVWVKGADRPFQPSTDPVDGYRILAQRGICTFKDHNDYWCAVSSVSQLQRDQDGDRCIIAAWIGEERFPSKTPLVAAMRCLVSSRYGRYVDLPEPSNAP